MLGRYHIMKTYALGVALYLPYVRPIMGIHKAGRRELLVPVKGPTSPQRQKGTRAPSNLPIHQATFIRTRAHLKKTEAKKKADPAAIMGPTTKR